MIVPLGRIRRNLGVLALLTIGAALGGAPLWTLLVLVATCLAVPAAVGLHGGPALVRRLLLGTAAPRGRAPWPTATLPGGVRTRTTRGPATRERATRCGATGQRPGAEDSRREKEKLP